jgi:hypothetical protein
MPILHRFWCPKRAKTLENAAKTHNSQPNYAPKPVMRPNVGISRAEP